MKKNSIAMSWAVVALLALSGCGGGSDSSSQTSDTPTNNTANSEQDDTNSSSSTLTSATEASEEESRGLAYINQLRSQAGLPSFYHNATLHKAVKNHLNYLLVNNIIDDKKLSLSYIQEYNKLCGNYAPSKKEITGKDGAALVPRSKKEVMSELRKLLE